MTKDTRVLVHISVFAILAIYFLIWPMWRVQFPMQIWPTESWNAYHQDAAAAGEPLYARPGQLVVNNYPPLSFIAIGALGKLFGDSLYVGRIISLLSLIAVAAEIVGVVWLLTGKWTGGTMGGLWFVAIMAHNSTTYVGANDPQLAGLALMGLSLVWFLARQNAGKAVEPALLLMVVAGFWKHNNIGIPLTVMTWLLIRDWRAARRPILVSAAAATAGLIICALVFPYFIANLLTPRHYGIDNLLAQVGHLQWGALAIVIWAIWAATSHGPVTQFTAIQIGWGLFSCLLQWLGHGVFGNAEFDLNMAVGIGIGSALALIKNKPQRDVIITLLALRLVASERQESAEVLLSPAFRQSLQAQVQAQNDRTARVAAIPGQVVCPDDNLICRAAGKAFIVDDFVTDEMIATGRYSVAEVDKMIRDRGITIFALSTPNGKPTR